jgi:putative ubiquitin-RnfH superfamily antitoxin RatB of RatAB toxin-antitoxin module
MARAENVTSHSSLNVMLVYSPEPRQVHEWALALPRGATVAQALAASPLFQAFPALQASSLMLGIWGRKTSLDHRLHDRDRLEIYRALRVDPKIARRERFNRQGAKSAGLFARSRPGAKAGY